MMDLGAAFYNVLNASAALKALLATYTVDGTPHPAIFTGDTLPEDAAFPCVYTAGRVSDEPFDTKTGVGRDVIKDIHIFDDETGSSARIDSIAEMVRDLFHRVNITVDGYAVFIASASGPVKLDTEGAYGRVVSVRLVATKNGG